MKRLFQAVPSHSQQAQRHHDIPAQRDEPLLTEREAATRCRYDARGCADPVRAFQKWARRVGVPVERAGRSRLYRWSILAAFLERRPWTARHWSHREKVVRDFRIRKAGVAAK